MHSATDLPAPDSEAVRRSEQVVEVIADACEQEGGLIPFSEYMKLALYHPAIGYYTGGLAKFGERGDFITAPEVSSLFSQCVANQVAEILAQLDDADVIEFGAGSGVMASDILLRLEELGQLPKRYLVLEVSAELRQRQRDTISERAAHLLGRVEWIDALPADKLDAVVLANEILDAMPVECFRKSAGEVERLFIGYENGGLLSDYQTADSALSDAVKNIEERTERTLPEQYSSEVNLNLAPWLAALHDSLASGVVLLIDYGYPASEYYLDDRDRGTLICHYQHRAHANPFWYPGLQDITAFVDFTDVAYCAAEAGFDVAGFTTQAAFLMSSGLADLHQQQVTDDVQTQVELAQQVKTLTLPSEMGEKFKVMALTCNFDTSLTGFMLQDQRGRL